ncbi:MAG TPA: hypothetical protein VH352_19370 [Pseudonocardiaceae bacterium]|jgi:hypothetical protein|nr:hypothetical protein [Pseudonocardiaceae bacterium]
MRSVVHLLSDDSGRDFLADRGIFADTTEFRRRLRVPGDPALAGALGLDRPYPVYVCQQTQIDYPKSVASKFRATVGLAKHPEVAPISLWMDTDHAKTAASTIAFTSRDEQFRTRVVPNRVRDVETRFLTVDKARVDAALTEVGDWLDPRVPEPTRATMRNRLARLKDSVAAPSVRTLAEVNLALSSVVLDEHLGFAPPSTLVSDVVGAGMLDTTLDAVLNHIDDFVAAFNGRIAELVAADIDPRVHTLPADYLPLYFSCPTDGLRRRLAHQREGADHLAVATCHCGTTYRFHLGAGRLSAAELMATGRWSVDVCLPLFVDGLVSGAVVGRSSALYGLVLNEVATKVLGIDPVPLLVPTDLPETVALPDRPDSVLHDYLTAS